MVRDGTGRGTDFLTEARERRRRTSLESVTEHQPPFSAKEAIMKNLIALGLVSAATIAGTAGAAITSTFGGCTQIAPPPMADFPFLVGPNAQCWDEQVNVTGTIFADLTTNPGSNSLPTPGVLIGMYDSHFIHWTGVPNPQVIGGVIFSAPIAAVAWGDTFLDLTDATWGAGGTAYPTGAAGRGITAAALVSVTGNMLRFEYTGLPGAIEIEQLRVWTHSVPAPGACSLGAMAGIAALRRRRR